MSSDKPNPTHLAHEPPLWVNKPDKNRWAGYADRDKPDITRESMEGWRRARDKRMSAGSG